MALRMRQQLGSIRDELRYEPTITRVRALVAGEVVIDSVEALLVWEPRRIVPVYAVPVADLVYGATAAESVSGPVDFSGLPHLLGPAGFATHTCPGTVVDVAVPGGRLAGAGFRPDDPELNGWVLLDFAAFDAWLVEDEPRVGHPHDPFKRISVHASARHVQVSLDSKVLGESVRALMLLETHLPPRWYLPPDDVRLDLLEPSQHRTTCAYKGHASYLSLPGVADDIGWRYPEPLDDALRVKDCVCFWSERTDLRIDGELQPRPVTPFSTPTEIAEAAETDRPVFG